MFVKRVFRILKGKWCIIMRRVDIPLRHMANVDAICIVLHNMCIIGKNKFDIERIEEAERELNRYIDNKLLRERQK